MDIQIEVDARDLEKQRRKLEDFDRIAAPFIRDASTEAIFSIENRWKVISPLDQGRYRSSISGRVESIVGLEVEGIVGTNVQHLGFPYPLALEMGDRYHYRRGPRTGQPTAGQVAAVLKKLKQPIEELYSQALDALAEALKVR